MELDIVTFKSYSIVNDCQFKINKDLINIDACWKSTAPCKFEKMFYVMFLITDFDHKLSSLIV